MGQCAKGGDSSSVQDQLKNVQHIQPSCSTFAAILRDGSVVTGRSASKGGDSSAVQDQLNNVQHIQSSCSAVAAILWDGSVVSWGSPSNGGDSSAVQDQLNSTSKHRLALLLPRMCRYMGWCRRGWRQQCCARPATKRAAHPSIDLRFCRHPWRWICRYMG